MPFSAAGSFREPVRTQMPTDTDRAWGIGSATSTSPFGNRSRTIVDVTLSMVLLH
jgi:hypothetical protein